MVMRRFNDGTILLTIKWKEKSKLPLTIINDWLHYHFNADTSVCENPLKMLFFHAYFKLQLYYFVVSDCHVVQITMFNSNMVYITIWPVMSFDKINQHAYTGQLSSRVVQHIVRSWTFQERYNHDSQWWTGVHDNRFVLFQVRRPCVFESEIPTMLFVLQWSLVFYTRLVIVTDKRQDSYWITMDLCFRHI